MHPATPPETADPRTRERNLAAEGAASSTQAVREGYLMVGVLLGFYVLDAALLGAYAALGLLPATVPLGYAATGALAATTLLWLARHRGPEALNSPSSVLCQTGIALLLMLGTAWLHPQVGLAMIFTAISLIASCALRLPSRAMAGTILATAAALVVLFRHGDAPPALPMQGWAEQTVSGLLIAWTLVKTASLNAIGARMRDELDRSHAALTAALEEVDRLASMDELTSLPNRRAILQRLAALRDGMTAGSPPLGLAMLDIDHFKQINDRYGHPTGDEVLRTAGAALRHSLRGDDLVGRIGGEEFVLLMPGLAQPQALMSVGERTRAVIESQDWSHIREGLNVTVSIGITLGRHGEPLESWLGRADRALYRAKSLGRNRVVLEVDGPGQPASPAAQDAQPLGAGPPRPGG